MSRNVRRKNPTTPVKANKSRRRRVSDTSESSLNLSDDSGYSAVDEISDSSDDDEEDVAAAEEENMMQEAQVATPPAPRPLFQSDDEDDNDEDDDQDGDDEDDEEAVPNTDHYEDGSWAGIMSDVDEGSISDFLQQAGFVESDTPTVERHVHFADSPSDSDSTDTDVEDHADMFPDLFVPQASLDSTFRREIEHDPDDSSGSASFWDFNHDPYTEEDSDAEAIIGKLLDDETPVATPQPVHLHTITSPSVPVFEESHDLELDGYETDGDTTDEDEDIPEPVIRRKIRRPSNAMSDITDSDEDCPVKTEQGQPRSGRVNLDRSDKKPIAVWDPKMNKMIVFTPHRRRQLDLSPEQFNIPWAIEEQSSPILSNSANLMLSAMFSSATFGDFANGSMGPAEAFFPYDMEMNAADEGSSASSTPDDEDECEKHLNFEDFLTMGASSDEEDDEEARPSSAIRPTTASSENDVLSHLNSQTVTAFRRNQINQQLILSNQATHDSLAFSGPYNYTALKGLKSDRFDTAAVPLTPMRRQKKQMGDLSRSPLESVSAKRKASNQGDNGHKRHRSISDVNFLSI